MENDIQVFIKSLTSNIKEININLEWSIEDLVKYIRLLVRSNFFSFVDKDTDFSTFRIIHNGIDINFFNDISTINDRKSKLYNFNFKHNDNLHVFFKSNSSKESQSEFKTEFKTDFEVSYEVKNINETNSYQNDSYQTDSYQTDSYQNNSNKLNTNIENEEFDFNEMMFDNRLSKSSFTKSKSCNNLVDNKITNSTYKRTSSCDDGHKMYYDSEEPNTFDPLSQSEYEKYQEIELKQSPPIQSPSQSQSSSYLSLSPQDRSLLEDLKRENVELKRELNKKNSELRSELKQELNEIKNYLKDMSGSELSRSNISESQILSNK